MEGYRPAPGIAFGDLALDDGSGYSNLANRSCGSQKIFLFIPSPMIAHGLYHFVFYVFWHDII
ncbi:MAG: hypothetical protein WCA96_11345 [Methylocella sp.]